ncbi:glycerol-3-phosphate dehydrogenase/oxidase [Planosporangium thailandense]|uniref:Glycerol-3-phosphate dehydrogenase/oxidase n=1 Tax=Planosporangium thailandense TaxID=765197 RepID=A0ABX0Y159_9ACTN|nr:glycerol-3-phosphate dehydrogenase/oxidase [Planosporangium thailandense]NJC72091.1 glycerol-3-phosphate dehydrogenase/oxidase [Planosporangium thailandense]
MTATYLSADRRARELAELADGRTVDVLVIGLGVTGAGVALDAASRGLSVAAIDAHDLAYGTSRWSSKLVHGGLRYLAAGAVGLAYESAVERGILLERTAPHLVTPLPFVLPLTAEVGHVGAATTRIGLYAADALRATAGTPRSALPASRRISSVETRRLFPAVRSRDLRGALLYWDGQLVDDARLVVALARTAAGHGAAILTRCRAQQPRAGVVPVLDTVSGRRFDLRARVVVNAAGVWADQLDPSVRLRPSRGTHLVLPAHLLGHPTAALTVPMPGARNRFAVVLPQPDGRVYVGLTDEPVTGPVPDVAQPDPGEVSFLLDTLRGALDVPVGAEDVLGAYAGLRPLLAGTAERTADLSRRHAVRTSADGLVTVVGGKLTTYRRMARDAVDAAVAVGRLRAGPCRTARLPLVGAGPAAWPATGATGGPPARLVARYGAEADSVAGLATHDPALLRPIAAGVPVTGVEVLWAVRHEGALDADDVLDRRTRIGLVPADRERALPAVRALLAATSGDGRG